VENGPQDLVEICTELATYMLVLCTEKNIDKIREEVKECIRSGRALEKFKEIVVAQGGNEKYIENFDLFQKARYKKTVNSNISGYIIEMNAEKIGEISCRLGAGRKVKEDEIDYTAGIILNKKIGDYVEVEEKIADLYSTKIENIEEYKDEFIKAVKIVNKDEYNIMYKNKIEEKRKIVYKIV